MARNCASRWAFRSSARSDGEPDALTLYTTPVLYLYLDHFRHRREAPLAAGSLSGSRYRHRERRNDATVGSEWRGVAKASTGSVSLLRAAGLSACKVGPGDYQPAPMLRCRRPAKSCQADCGTAAGRGRSRPAVVDLPRSRTRPAVESRGRGHQPDSEAVRGGISHAVALVDEARASLFPTVGLNANVTRFASAVAAAVELAGGSATRWSSTAASSGAGLKAGGGAPNTIYSLEGTIDWTPDVWGRVRRQVEARWPPEDRSAPPTWRNAQLSAQDDLGGRLFRPAGARICSRTC